MMLSKHTVSILVNYKYIWGDVYDPETTVKPKELCISPVTK